VVSPADSLIRFSQRPTWTAAVTFGLLSLLPSLVAIVLAIVTRRVILSLGLAVFVGAVLLAWKMPPGAVQDLTAWNLNEWGGSSRALGILAFQMWGSISDGDHVSVLKFSLLLGAMIGVLEASRSMRLLIRDLSARVRGRRGGQTLVAGLGLGIFFDDDANTLLLGGTMRKACDGWRISRAKLAYLVDSTAAPVAGLALVSTWVATEISLIGDGLPEDSSVSAFQLFVQSIVYRFYPIFALTLVFLIARTGRDWGPMLRAEREVQAAPAVDTTDTASTETLAASRRWHWLAAILPIVICVAGVGIVLVQTGSAAVAQSDAVFTSPLQRWGAILGEASSYRALIVGGLWGWLSALLIGWIANASWATLRELAKGSLRGAWQIMPAMFVLWFAWALSTMTKSDYLDTGGYLGEILTASLPAWSLPTVVFLVASLVAFSTGTSWGTMALLTPLAVQLSLSMSGGEALSDLVLATTGSVLAGAILGDHCSPISDTTVLSSRACGCDHVLHVRTQLPYALLAGTIAVLCGTLPAAWGVSPWISIVVGGVLLWGIVRACGRVAEAPAR